MIEAPMQKYLMHAPLYRQQNLFAQSGWAPSRSTLCQIVWQIHRVPSTKVSCAAMDCGFSSRNDLSPSRIASTVLG